MTSPSSSRVFVKTTLGLDPAAADGLDAQTGRILSQVDGQRSSLDISIALGYPLAKVDAALDFLDKSGLVLMLLSDFSVAELPAEGELAAADDADVDISSLITSAKARDAAAALAKIGEKRIGSAAERDQERRAIEDIYGGALGRALDARAERDEADRLAAELHEAERARKALEEEQRRLREEIERKERAEAEARARAEAERKAREEAERKARKAREEAERKAREEQERKERALREEAARKAREEAERLAAIERARQRRLGAIRARARNTLIVLSVALISAGGMLSYQTSRISPAECSDMAKRWLESPIETKSCSIALLPSPKLTIGGISSANGAIAFREAQADISLLPLLRGEKVVRSVSFSRGTATPDGILSLFRRARASREFSNVRDFSVRDLTLQLGALKIPDLEARALFASNGALDQAIFRGPGDLEGKALIYGQEVILSFTLPRLPAAMLPAGWSDITDISAQGYLEPDRFAFDSLMATHPSGRYTAKGEVRWGLERWSAQGSWGSVGVDLAATAPWLFARGRATLNGSFESASRDPFGLLSSSRASASGDAREFAVSIDIASALGVGSGGGLSAFQNAPIATSFDASRLSISLPDLSSRLFSANLSSTRDPDGTVSGAVQAKSPASQASFSIIGDSKSVRLQR